MSSYRSYRRPTAVLPDPSTLPFPANLIRLCSDCDLRKTCTAPVPGDGAIPAYVMFVGEAPGRDEDEWGFAPFVGMAGRQLDSLLFQIGLSRTVVFLSNTVHCRPPNNRDPKPAETVACARWLNMELELVNPRIIVALGAPAMRWFLGDDIGTVEHMHGRPVEKDGRIILPCYHPAAPMHGDTALLRHLYGDFQVLRSLVAGKTVADLTMKDAYPDPQYQLADTPKKWALVADEIMAAGQFAIDVETVERDTRLWSAQISTAPGTGWFLPADPRSKGPLDCTKWDAQAIVHYYLNDVNWLRLPERNFLDTMTMAYLLGLPQGLKELATRLCGIKMTSYTEVVRPGQRTLSVEYLTRATKLEWPDPPDVEETKWDNKKGRVITRIKHPWPITRKISKILADTVDSVDVDPNVRWLSIDAQERACVEEKLGVMPESSLRDIPFEDAMQYATRDADATLRVKLKMEKLIEEAGLSFILYMDTAILPMVDEMMRNGMPVNLDHFRALSLDYDARMRAKATELASVVGHPFNPNSSNQVAIVVYQELGFRPTKFTPTRLISTDDQELKKTKHPVAKGIIEYRRLSKIKGTYADSLTELAVPHTESLSTVHRVHTTLKTTRVATGRLSSSDPNLQNIPVRSKEGKAIRMGFEAAFGMKMAEGDLAQIEMCTQAHLAMCKGLIDLFLRGEDPHTLTASRIFGVSYEEAKKDKYRYPTKRANFGVIYMIGARGLSEQIAEYISDLEMDGEPVEVDAWPEDDCAKFIGEWYKLYPEVRDYQQEKAAQARRYGYVTDLFGRIRFIPEVSCPVQSIQEAGLRQAANMPVTASAQGIIKLAMVELWRGLPGTGWQDRVKWLMQIHDSLIVELDDDDAFIRDYITWMHDIMCGVVKLVVPVKVDFKIGTQWGKLEEYKLAKESE